MLCLIAVVVVFAGDGVALAWRCCCYCSNSSIVACCFSSLYVSKQVYSSKSFIYILQVDHARLVRLEYSESFTLVEMRLSKLATVWIQMYTHLHIYIFTYKRVHDKKCFYNMETIHKCELDECMVLPSFYGRRIKNSTFALLDVPMIWWLFSGWCVFCEQKIDKIWNALLTNSV